MTTAYLTHCSAEESREITLARVVERLINEGLDHLIPLAEEMAEGPISLRLMRQCGVDGALHDQIIDAALLPTGSMKKHYHPSDVRLLENCTTRGIVERFHNFQDAMHKLIREGQIGSDSYIASIPCGLMREVLTLNFEGTRPHIVGIDKDPQSLLASKKLAAEMAISHVDFYRKDALFLGPIRSVDVLISNGLAVYLDDHELLELFQQFQGSMSSGGYFITNHMTPESEWNREHATAEDLKFQHDFLRNIVRGRWLQHLRPISQVVEMLEQAGFDVLDVREGNTGIFPVYITRRQ